MANDRVFLVHTRSRKAVPLGKFSMSGKLEHGEGMRWFADEQLGSYMNKFFAMFEISTHWEDMKYPGDPRMFHLEYEEASLDFDWMKDED